MIRKLQTCLSGMLFLAICFAGMVIDSSIVAAVVMLGVALGTAGLIVILERIDDYLPERR